jgi:isopenicillin N synthase-like dioxygenase
MLERPDINYALGWSHGKEYFNDKPDYLKGSYYAQLLQYNTDNPIDNNVWPKQFPDLRQTFLDLGNVIRNIGFIILDIIDSYIRSTYPKYDINYRRLIEESRENTGRMLYYFPKNKAKENMNIDAENWCEWHNDHGSLTGLASAIYLDENENEINTKLTKTGLYIQNRRGEVIRVTFGKDDIAYQLGETLQIHSGGILHATPHAVKVLEDIPDDIARVTFALFMEPNKDVKMTIPEGSEINNILTSEIYKVPKVQERFKNGMTFGEFNDATINKYYK